MSDPTVYLDVSEQVDEALRHAPLIGAFHGERQRDIAVAYATSFALYEVADILRERAEWHASEGRHEAARALLEEADRLADRDRRNPELPPAERQPT